MQDRTVERQWTLEHVQEQVDTAVDDERKRWEGIADQALNRSLVPNLTPNHVAVTGWQCNYTHAFVYTYCGTHVMCTRGFLGVYYVSARQMIIVFT